MISCEFIFSIFGERGKSISLQACMKNHRKLSQGKIFRNSTTLLVFYFKKVKKNEFLCFSLILFGLCVCCESLVDEVALNHIRLKRHKYSLREGKINYTILRENTLEPAENENETSKKMEIFFLLNNFLLSSDMKFMLLMELYTCYH